MNDFWDNIYLGNSLRSWAITFGGIVLGFILIRIFKRIGLQWLKRWSLKTATSIDDLIVAAIEKTVIPISYFLVIYLLLHNLDFPEKVRNIIRIAILLVVTFYVLQLITKVIQYFVLSILKKQEDGDLKQKQARGLLVIVKVAVWILGIVFLLSNLGYDVTSIIAGLGIGGIAIALAAQTILGDLFSYFVILFDRPFEIGDFIIIDDKMGVVEYIGIKTTRLRTLSGEQLICSNKDLTDSRVHNYKRMQKRRVVFGIGVTYQTPADALESIPQLVKEIIEKKDDVIYDRGHFASMGDFSLNFEFVYYILSSDYKKYMNTQQEILLNIYRSFENKKIDFAYPTQTIFLEKNSTGGVSPV
ncbi:MAG: mechanosensitive ion channel family protein [Chitinophagaceae bacterium]|nr:mechanosensitive ion channel family protein [Chitinophagaceae bacterium]